MIEKQTVPINFAQGLDTKTDPKQVQIGKFLSLKNTIFDKGGLLPKRNGFGNLTSLIATANFCTTFNGGLTAIGNTLQAYSSGTKTWTEKGSIQPLILGTLPLVRNNLNQSQADSAVSANGLVCTAYSEVTGTSTVASKFVVANSTTGQNVIPPTVLPSSSTTAGSPRVFILGNYFIILYLSSVANEIAYYAVSTTNAAVVSGPTAVTTAYAAASSVPFDAVVFNNSLFVAWNSTSSGGIKMATLTSTLNLSTGVTVDSGHQATSVSVTVDQSASAIWVSYYSSSTSNGYVLAVNPQLHSILTATQIISSGTILNITSSASGGFLTVFYEVSNTYSYDSGIPTNFVNSITCTQDGTVGTAVTVIRSVGLASKAFVINGIIYFLTAYSSQFQPTYFLSDQNGNVIAKLAYENGGGYLSAGLPNVTVSGETAQFTYLYKDLIEALNTLGNSQQTTAGGIYSQTGINLATVTLNTAISSSEIGNNLNLGGGFGWMYDGYVPVEQNFFLWPDNIEVSAAMTGGNMAAQQYFYQVVYSWPDNQGNIFRSAPSIPVSVTTTGTTSSVTLNIPTLRLTYKTANPVKIEVYRWSTANQNYYQISGSSGHSNPVLFPVLNSTTSDSVTFGDTWADSSIVGNNLIYTTGGVIEDINPPAYHLTTLADTRQWIISDEDQNLLLFSKQVIEGTPVEFSDLLTFYVAPTTAAQGSTGPMTSLAPMDGNLIVFKKNAIYAINVSGGGPDNTGSNSQYGQPTFVTSTVGCSNQESIVFMPNGLMFQSQQGIWLLDRNLSVSYIGAAVEEFNSSVVLSALNIPGTTQVRFTLNTGETLMYDYYYSQWGTFVGAPGVSSCVYGNLHTFINSLGQVFQETPGLYLDGSNPVLRSFLTGHIQTQGVSGFQRIYEIQLLGQYISPHYLNFQIGYDFGPLSEHVLISPDNFSGVYGSDQSYGQSSPYGGPGNVEQWRIQTATQKCQAFQISLEEIYDPSFGVPSGAGFNLSAMTCTIGTIRGYRPVKATNTAGTD